MRRMGSAAACLLALGLWACSRGAGPLPPGAALGGLRDIEQPESYPGSALYTYMDGGAEFYLKQGFTALYVRRYGRGNERFVVELYEMKNASAASSVYQSSRRLNAEKELASGCLASVRPAEILAARGRYYLVGRNEDPLASQSDALIELSRNVLNRLPGPCALAKK
ncbi:MAG TPA: DUF6599 family protein [Candidatus Acidoferrales bacterium]|nr:DUF6599 family protein [Candidatus Acidoferrales bacterium]